MRLVSAVLVPDLLIVTQAVHEAAEHGLGAEAVNPVLCAPSQVITLHYIRIHASTDANLQFVSHKPGRDMHLQEKRRLPSTGYTICRRYMAVPLLWQTRRRHEHASKAEAQAFCGLPA